MGVLACDRKNCSNIMCDRISHKYGYICNECFNEMEEKRILDIEAFMDSPKPEDEPHTPTLDYETIFKTWD